MKRRSIVRGLLLGAALWAASCTKETGVDLTFYANRLVDGAVVDEGKSFVADVQGRMIYIDDVGLRVLPASPPSKIVLKTDIPRGGVLHIAAGIAEDKQSLGAVEFVVGVMENGQNRRVVSEVIDPISRAEHRRFVNLRADLSRFAGKDRELVLETRAFEKDGDLFRAFWGAPAIAVDPKFSVKPDPLVIVYLVDTLRADHTEPYGYSRKTTPELQKFARDSVVFERAISHASWTKPSVASLMTSRLPSRHRAVQLRDPLDAGQVTLAEMLDAKGFATGAVMANSVIYAADSNFQQGFDVFAGLHGEEGRRSKVVDTRLLIDRALAFVDSRRGLPTFLYVHTMDPHVPYSPPAPFDTMFEPKASPGHPGVDPRTDFKEALDRERLIAQYDGDIAYGDQQFGRFIDELKKRGVYNDALIVFVADHGEEFQDHGGWLHGRSVFDELVRVPLLVKFAGGRGSSSRVAQMVGVSDVLPTILHAMDMPVPDPPAIVGRPLQSVAFGQAPEPTVVSEISHRGFVSSGIRTSASKYIRRFEPQTDELFFDLTKDPAEKVNLIDQKPEGLRRLRSAVEATMQVTPYRYAIRALTPLPQTLVLETPGWIEAVESVGLGLSEKAEIRDNGRLLEITLSPRGGAPRDIYFRVRPVGVPVTLRGRIGSRELTPAEVFVGEKGAHPKALPFALPGLDADVLEGLFKPGPSKSGVVVYLDQPAERAVPELDKARVEELCALGYLSGAVCGEMTAAPRSIRLAVFDLDGTLIDSIGDIASSANQSLVEAYGEGARLTQDSVRHFVGGGARQLIERCVAAAGQSAGDVGRVFDRFIAIYASRLTETTRLYPGVAETLDTLAPSCRLAVLTNKPGDMSRAILQNLGLAERFVAVIGGDDLKTKKPDPEGLLKIAAQAGVSPAETALVGDSAIDVVTARNAGAFAVGVMWGYDREGLEREKPDVTLATPADLAGLLAATGS